MEKTFRQIMQEMQDHPDNNAMVFLYYDLAGIAPPVDRWVEGDNRVKPGPDIDKAAQRVAVRADSVLSEDAPEQSRRRQLS